MTDITFIEHDSPGYASRTRRNAEADVTIAIAVDHTTAGEVCTRRAVKQHHRTIIPLQLAYRPHMFSVVDVSAIVAVLNTDGTETLNIAGNGIYTLSKHSYTQGYIDSIVFKLLYDIVNHPDLKFPLESVCTGGQTGVDEAGAKAAARLGIPTTVVAPQGWLFRGIDGKDIADEQLFKARFS